MKKILLIIVLLFICSCSAQDIEPVQEFCGISTSGSCTSDEECTITGCSAEICQSVNEESMISICEWKDCYNNANHECNCVDNQCKWI